MPLSVADLVTRSYLKLQHYRWQLGLLSAILILVSALAATTIRMQEDISAMLPDRGSSVTRDFELLQSAPFARRAVINLSSAKGDQQSLVSAADQLANALDPQLFGKVASGPDTAMQTRLLPWLIQALPALVTEDELAKLADRLEQGGVEQRLEENYAKLLAPEGWALKKLIRSDPLGLHTLGLEKLRYLNLIPGMRVIEGHFISNDGHNALLLAEPPIAITDSAGARLLEAEFARAAAELPENIQATLTSGHRYTLANAESIQADLWWILSLSSLAILALFGIFLRNLRALFVFLLPVCVVCIAALAVAACFPVVSAITIGFGAVLLGITIDFGLHVYFALRHGKRPAVEKLREVVRPVLFGGLTTLAAFAVLLGSDLPGQRQLAVFAIAGITVALLLALWVLPHLVPHGEAPELKVSSTAPRQLKRRNWLLGGWLLLLILCAAQSQGLKIDGDLRSMSLIPEELVAAETQLRNTWGDFRGLAMIWSERDDMDATLELNYQLFQLLRTKYPEETPVSLAALLPPRSVQLQNLANWQDFWQSAQGQAILTRLLAKAKQLGFNQQAFAPFLASLEKPAGVQSLESLNRAGLAEISRTLVSDGHGLLTLVPDLPGLGEQITEHFSTGVIAVSPGGFRTALSKAIGHDFQRFIASALVAVGLLLVVLFRQLKTVLTAAVPVLTGLTVMFGVMASVGMSFNLFNVIATILVIGLGIDYGIFMVCRLRDGLDRATDRAVLVSGLTTLAGFGALALARHPALHSIGVTVLLGIGAALPAALLVIPALFRAEAT